MRAAEPNIFAYNDYRAYLRDWMETRRQTGFSLRWFARRAGFKAHNIMQLVITGKRNLTLESIAKFSRGLGLSDEQGQYFEDLVLLNQANDLKTRTKYYRKLIEYRDRRNAIPFEASQYRFFRHWLAPVLYEMTRLKDFKPDPRWIASCFEPALSPEEAAAVISDLVNSGFLAIRPDGSLACLPLRLDTGDNISDMNLFSYHEQALGKAADALHWLDAAARHYLVITSAGSSDMLHRLRQVASKFENEVWTVLDDEQAPRDEVYQVSLQIFPVLGNQVRATRRRKSVATTKRRRTR
jgi:uncharacterized protein (TIGR02147 family)